ncbi:Hypothetical protein UVM_LOCUS12 [uncultured virus]|nr:Hypothetical protein UVM_LOCUS12 [uncultured virus]
MTSPLEVTREIGNRFFTHDEFPTGAICIEGCEWQCNVKRVDSPGGHFVMHDLQINETDEQCAVCKFWTDDWLFFQCEKCDRNVCGDVCVSVVACQSRTCICSACFDRKCIECKVGDVPALAAADGPYYMYDSKPHALCDRCSLAQQRTNGEL